MKILITHWKKDAGFGIQDLTVHASSRSRAEKRRKSTNEVSDTRRL
jgi:hypothetical protein